MLLAKHISLPSGKPYVFRLLNCRTSPVVIHKDAVLPRWRPFCSCQQLRLVGRPAHGIERGCGCFAVNLAGSIALVSLVYAAGIAPPLATAAGVAGRKAGLPFMQVICPRLWARSSCQHLSSACPCGSCLGRTSTRADGRHICQHASILLTA